MAPVQSKPITAWGCGWPQRHSVPKSQPITISFSPKYSTCLNSALHSAGDPVQAPIAPFIAPAPAIPTALEAPIAPNAILTPPANNQGVDIPNLSEDEVAGGIHLTNSGRQSGANTYTMAELNMLVNTIAEVLLHSLQEWEELAWMVKPTSMGEVDPLCKQALEVDKLVQDCVEAAELDDPLPPSNPLEVPNHPPPKHAPHGDLNLVLPPAPAILQARRPIPPPIVGSKRKSSASAHVSAQIRPTKAHAMSPIASNSVIIIHNTSSKVDTTPVPTGPRPKQQAGHEPSLHVHKAPVAPVLTNSTGSQAQKSVAAASSSNMFENLLGKYLDPDAKQKVQAQQHKDNLVEIQINSKEWTIKNLHIENNKEWELHYQAECELDNLKGLIAGIQHPAIPAFQAPATLAAQLPGAPGAQLLTSLIAQLSAPVINQLLANLVAQLPNVIPTANPDGQAVLQAAPAVLVIPTVDHMITATDANPTPFSPNASPLVECNNASGSGLSYTSVPE
ncbi:hypothetical protein CTheo_8391 [Ceratobasidium theobromae]|uniref:Uncharacterized protein n=1 Tax=Ceratobasidium theobromae TaxID=1582974 RepID=A0A5N5Q974_9AGAM|nr:hypothetical protein CTheo_8391 [Ceratobasidium theobromae]